MRIPRIYQDTILASGQEIALDDTASQYLLKVLRLREGAEVLIFDGHGGNYQGMLSQINGKRANVSIQREVIINTESPLQLHVGLGISKGERMDYAIQKLVETGVHGITPLLTEYTVVKLDAKRAQTRRQHWRGVVTSACEQCGRAYLPQLHEQSDITTWLETVSAECKLVFDANGTSNLRNLQSPPQNVCVLIGPEGGLSDQEVQFAAAHDFHIVRLGPRILRTETAAVAISAALQTLWGDY